MVARSIIRLVTAAAGALLAFAAVPACADIATPNAPPLYSFLQLGQATSVHSSGGLQGNAPQTAFALGVGRRVNPNLSLELEMLASGTTFEGPPVDEQNILAYYTNTRDYGMVGLAGWIRVAPGGRRFVPYARAGLGIHWMTMTNEGVELLIFPSTRESRATAPGLQAALGAEAQLGEHTWLGLETRYLELEGRFFPVTPGSVNVGGGFWTVALRRDLGVPAHGKRNEREVAR